MVKLRGESCRVVGGSGAPDWPKSTLAILVLPLVEWAWLSQTLQLSSVTVKSVILTLWRHTPYSAVCNTKWTLTMKVQKWHFATEIHTVSQTHPHNYRDRGIYASGVAMVMRIQASFPSHLLHTAHSITSDKVCMPSSTCTVCLSGCLCLAKGRCVHVNCSRGINSRINQYQLTTGTFWPLSNVYKRFVRSWQRSTLSTHPVVVVIDWFCYVYVRMLKINSPNQVSRMSHYLINE